MCLGAGFARAEAFDLDAYLTDLAEKTKDPWQKAIYADGARDAEEENGKLTFCLRSFNPQLKTLPVYSKDPDAWREAFLENISAFTLQVTVTVDADGRPDAAGLKKLKAAVTKAASDAKTAFGGKAVLTGIADMLLPKSASKDADASGLGELHPDYRDVIDRYAAFSDLDAVQFAPLFYTLTRQSLAVKDGPHALELRYKGADPAGLIQAARQSAYSRLGAVYLANAMSSDEIERVFAEELGKQAAQIKKKGPPARHVILDVDQLADGDFGESYQAYIDAYNYHEALDELVWDVWDLPDAPPQPMPKTGRMTGSTSGTKVIINVPDDGFARYLQFRNASTDKKVIEVFIRSGGKATVYVPKGFYYLLIASGSSWYGTDGLFGDEGVYSVTDREEILSKSYYHTYTLERVRDGNLSIYGADPDRFRK
jgi:hypothetical protein